MPSYCLDLDAANVTNSGVLVAWGGAWETLSGTCARTYVMVPSDSYAALAAGGGGTGGGSQFTTEEVSALKLQAATPGILNLSSSDGALVGGAIASTWAAAWVFKALKRALNVDGEFEK